MKSDALGHSRDISTTAFRQKQKQEEENSQIVQAVRSLKLTPAQLMAFLNAPKNSLTASGHTDPKPEAPEKEDTAHEEN